MVQTYKAGMFAAVIGIGLAATAASASINSFDLFASNYHWQYGATPTSAYAFTFFTRIASSDPADLTSARAVHTTAVTPPMIMTDYGSEWSYTSPVYSTAALRNSNFPTGMYAFQVSGGTLGSLNAFQTYSNSSLFPVNPPAFTNIAALRDLDVRVDTEVPVNTFTLPTGVSSGHTFIAIFDGSGGLVAEGDSEPNAGPFTLPANILAPSQTYTVSLYYSCRVHTEGAGFSGATSDAGWDAITSTTLTTTRACSTADYNNDGDTGTDQDIEAFFACLGGNCCPTCWSGGSDFNGDGDSGTDQDIEAFFRVLAGHAC
jgi:hypothetical protein